MTSRLNLSDADKFKKHSQFGQEGFIRKILDTVGVVHRVCVEFGATDGYRLSNTALLAEERGFRRVMFELGTPRPEIGLFKAAVTPENINQLFREHDVPIDFDFLSIDIDGNDYWVWKALEFTPRVVQIECNQFWPIEACKVMPYMPGFRWRSSCVDFGASVGAMIKLGAKKGYSAVWSWSPDLFFVRSDLLHPDDVGLAPSYKQSAPRRQLDWTKWLDV